MQTLGAEIGIIPRGTSLILSMNNKGPQIDPWGIPVGRFWFLFLQYFSSIGFLIIRPSEHLLLVCQNNII